MIETIHCDRNKQSQKKQIALRAELWVKAQTRHQTQAKENERVTIGFILTTALKSGWNFKIIRKSNHSIERFSDVNEIFSKFRFATYTI